MKNLLILLFLVQSFLGFSQQNAEERAVVAVIETFFDGMRAGDSSMVRKTLTPTARLQTTLTGQDGQPRLVEGSIEKFLTAVGTPHEEVWDEKIWSYDVQIEDNLATCWTEYSFFLGDKLSHCGVNAFHLFQSVQGWKITQITDTRRFEACKQEPLSAVNNLLDKWHRAAATADEEVFFSSMTEDAVYLGTDPSERWMREEFRNWAKKHFERESAWDFKVNHREVYFAEDGNLAWFEESLDTWMGQCRGSGVVVETSKGWKIKHYNLSLTLTNDKMDAFRNLIDQPKQAEKNE